MTFSLGGCVGLTQHASQTPWGAIGIGLAATTPTMGAGSSTSGFGSPGQGGGSTGSGSGGEGTPVAGMYFFHRDQVGSTKLMTNSAGEMVAGANGATNLVYNPYGDIDVDHSHGPDILRNKFTGQELDNESGLYYYNARYYDPALGRFITADSVMDTGGANGMNRYMYTNGNPILFNDPTGHDAPKWMENMNKDITNAMIESVVQQAGPELTLGYMFMEKRSRDRYEHKAGRALENPAAWFDRQVINPIQHMSTVELVIGAIFVIIAIIVDVVSLGSLAWADALIIGIGMNIAGQIAGRQLNGYSDSNLTKLKWNSGKADRGQRIGGEAVNAGLEIGNFANLFAGGFRGAVNGAATNTAKDGLLDILNSKSVGAITAEAAEDAAIDKFKEYAYGEIGSALEDKLAGHYVEKSIRTFDAQSTYNKGSGYFDFIAITGDPAQYIFKKTCKQYMNVACPY